MTIHLGLADTSLECSNCGSRILENEARAASWRLWNEEPTFRPTCCGCEATERSWTWGGKHGSRSREISDWTYQAHHELDGARSATSERLPSCA